MSKKNRFLKMPEWRESFFFKRILKTFLKFKTTAISESIYMERREAEPQRGERLKIETGCEGALFSNDHAAPQKGTNGADPLSGMLEKGLFL